MVRSGCGRRQLVAEIAVAGLGVDEAEAGITRQPRRRDEVVDQAIQPSSSNTRTPPGKRRSRIGFGHAAIGAGRSNTRAARSAQCVNEGRRRGSPSAFGPKRSRCRDQLLSQRGDRRLRSRVHQRLMGIGAAIPSDGDRFPTPHQLGTADAEVPPAAARVSSVGSRRASRQPSIGRMQNRFPTRTPPRSEGLAERRFSRGRELSSKAIGMPLRSRCARNASALFSDATRG